MFKNITNLYKIKQFVLKNMIFIFLSLILILRFYYPNSYLFIIQGKMYIFIIFLIYFLIYQDNLMTIEENIYDYLRRPKMKTNYKITRYKEFFINILIFCIMFIMVSFVADYEYLIILITMLFELAVIILIFMVSIVMNNKSRILRIKNIIVTAICVLIYTLIIPSSLLLDYETNQLYYNAYGFNSLILICEIIIVFGILICVKEKTYYE